MGGLVGSPSTMLHLLGCIFNTSLSDIKTELVRYVKAHQNKNFYKISKIVWVNNYIFGSQFENNSDYFEHAYFLGRPRPNFMVAIFKQCLWKGKDP